MTELPAGAEKLFAVSPDAFVAERQRLVKVLRAEGKAAEADVVAGLRKPSAVVLAVNRAARDRPKAADAAAKAAVKVERAQARAQADGDLEGYRAAMSELDAALDLLSEVGVAHVSPSGTKATDAMRRRVHDLLRRAVANDETRAALKRGVLGEEQEAAGFAAIPGLGSKAKGRARETTRTRQADSKQREREKASRAELAAAEKALVEAETLVRAAERERDEAERQVASARSKLERTS